MMTKEQAKERHLDLWRSLPEAQRLTCVDVVAYVAANKDRFQFAASGDRQQVVMAWIRDEFNRERRERGG